MRLLLAEDDPDLAQSLRRSLVAAGYAVDLAKDGEEAAFLGETEPYDVMVLDLGLPRLDGVAVLRRWRAGGVPAPVLILTARDGWSEKVAGFAVPIAGSDSIACEAMRNRRCWKRHAPVTPASVHSRSRSGGLSDSMNQRAVSAP